ncbi:MAG: hypothetical protein K8823_29 [Cenarchaeum symbiont of Oopsacas minuta]|nr:hypothetical protein [Cenarchaeum symbiont of Oopsacas minuta]
MMVLDSCVVIRILCFNIKNQITSYIDMIEKMIFFGSLESVFQTNMIMEKYAKTIESKYEICHYLDSLILTATKFHKSSIVTFDNMLNVSKHEHILTYDIKKLKDLRNLA